MRGKLLVYGDMGKWDLGDSLVDLIFIQEFIKYDS